MAWFKRKRDDAPADGTAGDVAPAPEPGAPPDAEDAAGAAPPPGPAERVASAAPPAWTTAPPMPSVIPTLQRSLGRIEAKSATTLGRPAPLSLAPLGHAVTPDAPTGVIGTLPVAEPVGTGPARPDQPPLDYVQRAPAGAVSPRPPAPAQLVVPSFQPASLPRVPVAAPEVQRSAATPSFTTAPDPTPPLVLPVGEILPPAPAEPSAEAPPAAPPAPAAAPLLAEPTPPAAAAPPAGSPTVQRAVELPLAPVQRHADHPGHVDGDEAPAEPAVQAEVQRAALDAPAAAATPDAPPTADAPLLADSPLLSPSPLAGADVPAASPGPEAAPAADLPLAPVQRHADHPGHVDGDEAPAEPAGAEVQRAAADAPGPAAPPAPTAPLVGDAPPLAAIPAPDAAAAPGPSSGAAPAPPAGDLPLPGPPVQRRAAPRRPRGLGAPIPSAPSAAGPPAPVQRAPLPAPAPPAPDAPLVGDAPRPPVPSLPLAAVQRVADDDDQAPDDEGDSPAAGPGAGAPSLDLAQRAPLEAAAPGPSAEPAPGADAGAGATAPLVGDAPLEPTIASPAAAGLAATGAPADAADPVAPSPGLDLVQRAPRAASGASSPSATGPAAAPSSSTATPGATPLPPLLVAPLLGGRPFATQVQRAAQDASAPAGLVDRTGPEALSPDPGRVYQPLAGIGMWNGAPPPDLPGPAVEAPPAHIASAVQRATGTDVANTRIRRDTGPTVQRLEARAFTSEGEVHIPASVGNLSSGEGASLVTHELVHVGQQSVLGSSRPHEHTAEGQHLEAQARSAEQASLAGTELPRLPLAPPPAPTVQRAPADGGGSSPFSPDQLHTLMRLADNPPGTNTVVQRADVAEAPPRPSTAAPELPSAATDGGPTPSPGPRTPQEIEELATKLFPTMRNLLRGELLGFRRRYGTSSDQPLS